MSDSGHHGWKGVLELGRFESTSELEDDERVEMIMEYLTEMAPKFCYDINKKKDRECKCLSCLDDYSLRNSVALWTLGFARLDKPTQQMLVMEKIRATNLVLADDNRRVAVNQPLYFIPFTTELPEVAEVMVKVKVCRTAMMVLLRMGKIAWATCKQAVDSGSNPQHGLKGQECARSRKFKLKVEPALIEFFETVVKPLSGPRPTRSTRQASGAIDVRDYEDTSELDPEWTKRRLFGRYCYDLGYAVSKGSVMVIKKRKDEDWLASDLEYGEVCSWAFFWGYWNCYYSKIVVRKPSKDICGLCYQFHLGNRAAQPSTPTVLVNDPYSVELDDNDDSSLIAADDNDEDDEDKDKGNDDDNEELMLEEREQEIHEKATIIKQHIEDATSMRELCRKVVEEAKAATRDNVADSEMVITIVADYCQNMEMPFFGKDQPGDTYYYTPKTINMFGIVNCNAVKDILYAYGYGEEHGGKGGNNVASLLMKHLADRGLLDGVKRKTLNVVMDNCPGQNKNNFVLRLALYLTEKGYFSEVNFIFLVVGHTKNVADRLFNILKRLYRAQNIFTMGMLLQAMEHELTIPYVVDWHVFKNWDKYLNRIYKAKMSAVKKWQIFGSSSDLGLTKMSFRSSNVAEAETAEESLKKRGVTDDERNIILLEQPGPLYDTEPGLREIKQVELWSKYRPLVPQQYQDECCPRPAKEVIDREKNKKKAKGKLKRDEKKVKGKLKMAPSTPIVAAATASASISHHEHDAAAHQELTIPGSSTNSITAPSSPSKRSREDAELE
jgi:hypothetical protein